VTLKNNTKGKISRSGRIDLTIFKNTSQFVFRRRFSWSRLSKLARRSASVGQTSTSPATIETAAAASTEASAETSEVFSGRFP